MSVSQAILGLTLKAQAFYATGTTDNTWLNLSVYLLPVCVISSALGYGLGLGPILFSMLGEIFNPKIKGLASAIVMSCRYNTIY